ncbi:MAG: PfkB family carbohydrate kinase [Cellulosilyticaceae bacterium]
MKVVTFGEIMLRLAPEGYLRFNQGNKLEATYGGAEANVAISLAHLGVPSSFVTKLPANDMAQGAIDELRKYGVDTSSIVRGGERIGIYFLEKGASQRASKVIYDRAYSAMSEVRQGEFDWDTIFADATWFHFTGITPALSEDLTTICLQACREARARGITVSCDVNYRPKLWSIEKAREVLSELMYSVDVCIANEGQAAGVFEIEGANEADLGAKLCKKFGFKYVAMTQRKALSASDHRWSAALYEKDTEKLYQSRVYDIHLVDRVGGGDSFAAGLISSMVTQVDPQYALEFGVAASCLKHTIEGDYNRVSRQEVEILMEGNDLGRVQR